MQLFTKKFYCLSLHICLYSLYLISLLVLFATYWQHRDYSIFTEHCTWINQVSMRWENYPKVPTRLAEEHVRHSAAAVWYMLDLGARNSAFCSFLQGHSELRHEAPFEQVWATVVDTNSASRAQCGHNPWRQWLWQIHWIFKHVFTRSCELRSNHEALPSFFPISGLSRVGIPPTINLVADQSESFLESL